MKNWKTTLFGALAAVGGFLAHSTTGLLSQIGAIVGMAATYFMGNAAADASAKS